VVSVHVRMNASTAGLITPADLAAMKPSAVFVNTSRAGLVAPGVLLAALNAGRPGMAAVDVLEVEPLHDAGDPFINHPNVIAPPMSAMSPRMSWRSSSPTSSTRSTPTPRGIRSIWSTPRCGAAKGVGLRRARCDRRASSAQECCASGGGGAQSADGRARRWGGGFVLLAGGDRRGAARPSRRGQGRARRWERLRRSAESGADWCAAHSPALRSGRRTAPRARAPALALRVR
jgi:hypothetical protein